MVQIDIEMPKTCGDCPLSDPEMYCPLSGLDIAAFNKKRDDCPLKEVKHGKWITHKHDNIIRCSVCNEEVCFAVKKREFNFCPNCGARMDK